MPIHSSTLDQSEIDLSPKWCECERSMRTEIDLNESEIDLNECEHFLKANQAASI